MPATEVRELPQALTRQRRDSYQYCQAQSSKVPPAGTEAAGADGLR